MNKKKADMLFVVLKCQTPVALSDLWARSSYASSMRTVRSDINHINDFLQENGLAGLTVYRDGRVAFSGSEAQRQQALHVLLNRMDFYKYRLDSQERPRVLLCHMIQADGYVNHKELCAVVYVSRGTLYTDMQQCARLAAEYGLTLSSAPSKGYILDGAEWDKRRALHKLQKRWSEKDEQAYADYKSILNSLEAQDGFVFTDRGYLETLRYIEISLQRIGRGYMLSELPGACIPLKECKGAAFVWAHLSAKFQIVPMPEELIALELYLRTSGRVAARKKALPGGLREAVSAYFGQLSTHLTAPARCAPETYRELNMFLSGMRFGSNEEYVPNPLIGRVLEEDYPGLTEAVDLALPALSAWLGRELSPGERYQLTVFTASALEAAKPARPAPRVMLVCDNGPGEADYLRAQVARLASMELVGVTAAHAVARLRPEDVELLISTVPLGDCCIPTIQVSPVLTYQDAEKIFKGLLACLYSDRPSLGETEPQA